MGFNADQIRQTLAALMHEQGQEEIGAMLDASRATVSHRHNDFDRSYYDLELRIPLPLMARLEPRRAKVEQKLADKLPLLGLDTAGEAVIGVSILVDPPVGAGAVSVRVPTRTDEARIWKPGNAFS